jgi:hypothetical protein
MSACPDRRIARNGPVMAILRLFFLTVLFALCNLGARALDAQPRPVLGFAERVYVGELQLAMNAKLDTGADTSSVFATGIRLERKQPDGTRWIEFRLTGMDGRVIKFRKKLIRYAQIKLKTGGTVRRPVVSIPVCIGGILADAEVNLADRSEFNFPMLIGREFMAHKLIVDPALEHVADDVCPAISSGTYP